MRSHSRSTGSSGYLKVEIYDSLIICFPGGQHSCKGQESSYLILFILIEVARRRIALERDSFSTD